MYEAYIWAGQFMFLSSEKFALAKQDVVRTRRDNNYPERYHSAIDESQAAIG